MPPDRHRVLESCLDGIAVIRELAAEVSDWSARTPCTEWRATDLVSHLRCVAENLHEYLNDAPNSRLARLFAQQVPSALLVRQLSRQNAAELAVLPQQSPAEHVIAFTMTAEAYAGRLPAAWDRPYLVYRGIRYVAGDHAGAVSVEWHLHAWDLARALGKDYRPRDADLLVGAWRTGVPHLPLGRGDSWETVLRASGRTP